MMQKRTHKMPDRKWRLPIYIIMLSTLITLVGMLGLLALSYYLTIIIADYDRVVTQDSANLQYVDSVSRIFYEHQALTFQYMVSMEDQEKSSRLEERAKKLQEELTGEDYLFGENVIGTPYESDYHEMHSKLNGYFGNVERIYDFHSAGDLSTADYYMDTILSENIENVMAEVDHLNQVITDDVNISQKKMSRHMAIYRNLEFFLIIAMAVVSILVFSRCLFISYDIVNKDSLTQLFTLEKLEKDVNRRLQRGKAAGYVCICCNLKGFSLINQNMGKQTGDIVLKNYADSMKKQLDRDEEMARIGGDKFLLFIKKERVEEFQELLKKYPVRIELPDGGVQTIDLEHRCGLYEVKPGDDFSVIMDASHLALSRVKQTSSDGFLWFDQQLIQESYDRKKLLTLYEKGIENREFLVYYQPKVDIDSNRLCGCEALVRWKREDGLVPPVQFIPVLEEEGTVTELDFYVFDQVCRDLRDWLDAGIEPVRVSSNFSKLHLRNPHFAEDVMDVIQRYRIDHKYIEVEITESSGYEDFEALTHFVHVMNDNQVFVSIDDFGTGYSSLSMLKDLNVDVVKLDKSFIDGIGGGDSMNENLLKNVIHMIKDLDRHIICEGVETAEQAEFLSRQDCHTVQGYLYDKPLSHDEFEERLKHPVYELM